jgi:hypothetical protein
MTLKQTANNAKSNVATTDALNNTTDPVTFSVTTGHGSRFPAPGSGFWITVWDAVTYPNDPFDDPDMEIMLCTARSGDSLTCDRGEQSTVAVEHTGTPAVRLLWTKGNVDDIQTHLTDLASDTTFTPVIGSDAATSIAAGASTTKTIACTAGRSFAIVHIAKNAAGSGTTGGMSGTTVFAAQTASESRGHGYNAFYHGDAYLSDAIFAASGNGIYLESATYDPSTGEVDLVFKSNSGSSQTLNARWWAVAM